MNILKFKKKDFITSINHNIKKPISNFNKIEKKFIFFSKIELSSILNLYSRQVSKGYWRDYAIDSLIDHAIFSVYRHSQDNPMYQIIKKSQKGFRNKPMFFIKKNEEIINKSNNLFLILSNFEKKLNIKKIRKH